MRNNMLVAGGAALVLAGSGLLAGSAQAADQDVIDADVPVEIEDTLNGNHVLDGGVLSPIVPVGGVVGVDH